MEPKPFRALPVLPPPSIAVNGPHPIAVIDIGSTSIRMTVAQSDPQGAFSILDTFAQPVSLGKDTFTKGSIEAATIEECVSALIKFKSALAEYGLADKNSIRVIATSAVREATNRDSFVERVYISTGFLADVIDESEISRYTFLSIQPLLGSHVFLKNSDILVIEVGGGTTEILFIQNGRVTFSNVLRFGAYRIRETLSASRPTQARLIETIENQISRTVEQIREMITSKRRTALLVLGGDARFAATELGGAWDKKGIAKLPVQGTIALGEKILKKSVDEIVKDHKLSYADAETLGPAVLMYARLATAFKLKTIHVAAASIREGVIAEIIHGRTWSEEFRVQIVHSALELGKKYSFHVRHAECVANLCRVLFHALAPLHGLSPRHETLLNISALLHDIGQYVSMQSHHKHSMYLIQNSKLFGLGERDVRIVSLAARYHRKAVPKPVHPEFMSLDFETRITVAKMAALLRIADALDAGYTQQVSDLAVSIGPKRVVCLVPGRADIIMEQISVARKSDLFEQLFGKKVVLEKAPVLPENAA